MAALKMVSKCGDT